tara:strand:+ start:4022 stop:4621 length:600 start_codon:yes stop_codon:yes gene_type:complete
MNLNDIKEHYKNFDDWKIEKIATNDSDALPLEVLNILKEEIKNRALTPNLMNRIDLHIRGLSELKFMDAIKPSPKKTPSTTIKVISIYFAVMGFAEIYLFYPIFDVQQINSKDIIFLSAIVLSMLSEISLWRLSKTGWYLSILNCFQVIGWLILYILLLNGFFSVSSFIEELIFYCAVILINAGIIYHLFKSSTLELFK